MPLKTYQIVLTLEVMDGEDVDKRVYSYLKELMDDNSLDFEETKESENGISYYARP